MTFNHQYVQQISVGQQKISCSSYAPSLNRSGCCPLCQKVRVQTLDNQSVIKPMQRGHRIISQFPTRAKTIFTQRYKCLQRYSPLRISIGLAPLLIFSQPSLANARAKIVAAVVPSPASSFVRFATSWTNLAPMFWNLSFNSIDFATVTPSLVILGLPQLCSMTTFRPCNDYTHYSIKQEKFNEDAHLQHVQMLCQNA